MKLIVCLFSALFLFSCENKNTNPPSEASPEYIKLHIEDSIKKVNKEKQDSADIAHDAAILMADNHNALVYDLQDLSNFDKHIKDNNCYGSLDDVKAIIYYFEDCYKDIERARISVVDSTTIIANKVEKLLPVVQSKYLPRIRKEYAKQVHQTVWEADGKATCTGFRNTRFRLKHYSYMYNANVKKDYETFYEWLYKMRFKRADFYWNEYAEYSYYQIESPADTDPY